MPEMFVELEEWELCETCGVAPAGDDGLCGGCGAVKAGRCPVCDDAPGDCGDMCDACQGMGMLEFFDEPPDPDHDWLDVGCDSQGFDEALGW